MLSKMEIEAGRTMENASGGTCVAFPQGVGEGAVLGLESGHSDPALHCGTVES